MAIYRYRAAKSDGRIINGEMEADSPTHLKDHLENKGLFVLESKKIGPNIQFELGQRIKIRDKIAFTRQLRVLLKAGLPMLEAFEILINQENNRKLKSVLENLHKSIKGGRALSEAMAAYPDIFPDYFRFSVKAGEKSGALELVLDRLAAHMERSRKTQGKVKAALVYPGVLTLVAVGVILFLIVHVVPTFNNIFEDLGATLPASTRLLLLFSNSLRYNIPILLAVIAGFFLLGKTLNKFPQSRTIIDKTMIKTPLAGDISLKYSSVQTCHTLATLLISGVPMVDAIATSAMTIENRVLSADLQSTVQGLKEGRSLSSELNSTAIFPPLMIQMIGVGERTGALEEVLETVADYFEEEVDIAVESLVSLIEPLLMIAMGTVVGFIVLAMFLPILQMGTLARI